MEKKMNNKGFSLVELIIVIAIMAVLIGVLAPAYLQYVEKSKKTSDASAVGSVMDAVEIIAADPAVSWGTSDTLKVTFSDDGCKYTGLDSDALAQLKSIVPESDCKLTGAWTGSFDFEAKKDSSGNVTFTGSIDEDEVSAISSKLAGRYN